MIENNVLLDIEYLKKKAVETVEDIFEEVSEKQWMAY